MGTVELGRVYNRHYEKFSHFKVAVTDFFQHTDQFAEKIQY